MSFTPPIGPWPSGLPTLEPTVILRSADRRALLAALAQACTGRGLKMIDHQPDGGFRARHRSLLGLVPMLGGADGSTSAITVVVRPLPHDDAGVEVQVKPHGIAADAKQTTRVVGALRAAIETLGRHGTGVDVSPWHRQGDA